MIKGIVFDMDGLMFGTERLSADGWIIAGEKMGKNITPDISNKTLGLNIENTKLVFEKYLGSDFDYYTARKIKVEYMTSYIEKNGMPVKKGLIELLDFLRSNGYRFTVATSNEKSRVEYYFEKAGISGYFDGIVCSGMVENGKPAPDIFLKACEIIRLSPSDCVALEDSPLGILSAYRAGLKPVMIPDMLQPDEETEKLLCAKLPSLFDVIGLLSAESGLSS